MLELKLAQTCNLTHVNGRKEYHGEDRVTAVDLSFKGSIKDALIDRFSLDEENLSDTFWKDDEDCTVRHPQLGAMAISMRYESHQVKLFSSVLEGNEPLLVLNECRIVKIKVKPQDGGVADITFQVQGEVADNEAIGKIFNEFLGSDIRLDIQPQQTDLVEEANAAVQSGTSESETKSGLHAVPAS